MSETDIPNVFETARLTLRNWKQSDTAPFAAMNPDPKVMEFYPDIMTAQETQDMIDRIDAHFDAHGFGLWATELKATGEFIGYIGTKVFEGKTPFAPCIEIGWRIAAAHWGKGYAPEGARKILEQMRAVCDPDQILSFTATINTKSRKVMEKIGMFHDPAEDFDHPNVEAGHPLQPHVLYRMNPKGTRVS
jgi:ribosomal-protein-alanine N-acetyltransferase